MFTDFDSIKKLWLPWQTKWNFKQFFKNFLQWNCFLDFEMISQECALGDLFKVFAKFWSVKKNALVNGGFYTDMKKFLQNPLLWNGWSDFEIISQEFSLGDPFQKQAAKFWSINKHGFGEWGLLELYRLEEILKNSSSLKLLVRFWNNFTVVPWMTFFKYCSLNFDPSTNMAVVNGGLLALYGHEEIL